MRGRQRGKRVVRFLHGIPGPNAAAEKMMTRDLQPKILFFAGASTVTYRH